MAPVLSCIVNVKDVFLGAELPSIAMSEPPRTRKYRCPFATVTAEHANALPAVYGRSKMYVNHHVKLTHQTRPWGLFSLSNLNNLIKRIILLQQYEHHPVRPDSSITASGLSELMSSVLHFLSRINADLHVRQLPSIQALDH